MLIENFQTLRAKQDTFASMGYKLCRHVLMTHMIESSLKTGVEVCLGIPFYTWHDALHTAGTQLVPIHLHIY